MKRASILALLGLAGLALLTAGCSGDSSDDVLGRNAPNVRMVLATDTSTSSLESTAMDHGGDGESSPNVVAASIRVSDAKARSTTEQRLVDIDVDFPVDIDLFALADRGGTIDLGIGYLPPDTYDQLVLVINALTLTGQDGTVITIEPPGGGWTVLAPTGSFTVVEGEVTTISVRFKMSSFKFRLDADLGDIGDDDFDPEIEIEVD